MGAVVLDSSVLIGILNPSDAHHEAAATAVAERRQTAHAFVLPATVLAETLVATARHRPAKLEEIRALLDALFGPVRPVDEAVAVEAARLRAKYKSVRLPDALVVATALVDDAAEVLTADTRLKRVDNRVTVI